MTGQELILLTDNDCLSLIAKDRGDGWYDAQIDMSHMQWDGGKKEHDGFGFGEGGHASGRNNPTLLKVYDWRREPPAHPHRRRWLRFTVLVLTKGPAYQDMEPGADGDGEEAVVYFWCDDYDHDTWFDQYEGDGEGVGEDEYDGDGELHDHVKNNRFIQPLYIDMDHRRVWRFDWAGQVVVTYNPPNNPDFTKKQELYIFHDWRGGQMGHAFTSIDELFATEMGRVNHDHRISWRRRR